MATKPRPKTEFPSPEVSGSLAVRGMNIGDGRHTKFPAGLGLQKFLTAETTESPIVAPSKGEEAARTTSPILLKANPPNAIPTRPLPEEKIKIAQRGQPSNPEIKSPWDTYTALRSLQRGGEVTAACTRTAPIRMVAVKKLSSDHFKEYRSYQHENLLAVIQTYRFKGQFFVITDYTATTLRHILAIPLPLQELHVSATCRQGSPLFSLRIPLSNIIQVFEGMQYLSRFGIGHKRLDGSKVLFSSDGCVKIAHFDDCQSTESASAHPLGIIAIEMMQNGISPASDEKLVLKNPDQWSPEASNFIEVISWATLKEIRDVRAH
ncbi:hypothetical protein BGZ60DRAFT_429433 [Tricladium varicosporioides]|nr:hypothetical protein BGZ60DRAFT_429433 [Hymenoscyphus varicosporioides]